ncbi:MAG: glutathione S-transferase family protein [Pseudomonadales bacterium]
MSTIKLYRHPLSGHSHRVELLLSLLGINADIIDVDLLQGAHKTPEFLLKNPAGQVPVLEDGDIVLSDSNAILVYLASKYDATNTWLPTTSYEAAEVQKCLTAAAGPIAFGPAAARLVNVFGAGLDHEKAKETAHGILRTLDDHLASRNWMVGFTPTVADVANYAYIAHAPEGDVALDNYPNVRSWLRRIETLPGFVPMQATPVGLAA